MKKTCYFLVSAFICCMIISCSEEEINTNLNESNISEKLLQFSSSETANAKIEEVIKFKEEKESEILNKILERSGNKVPTPGVNLESKEVNKTELLDYLNFYHEEKLKVVYEEREMRGFTSLQNLADEINSLKLLDQKKSNDLYEKYSSLLFINEFTVEPFEQSRLSNIYNLKGEVSINNKMIVSQKQQISSKANTRVKKYGILAISSDDLLYITWSAGLYVQTGFLKFRDLGAATFSSYVKINSQFIPYPAWFYADANSRATFFPDAGFGCNTKSVNFPTSAGTHVRSNDAHVCLNGGYEDITGLASGTFIIATAWGTFVTATGSHAF